MQKSLYINLIFLIFILLASLCFRIIPYWQNAFKNNNAYSADPDSCYHLRRAEISAQHFPQLMIIDSFSGADRKNNIIWAPLYDWVLAFLWFILYKIGFAKIAILKILFFLPPIIATINVYLVYKLSMLIFNNEAGALLSSFFFAILPRGIVYSSLGNLDHHSIEILMMTIVFTTFIKFLKTIDLYAALKLAISIAISTLIWTGSIFFAFCCILITLFSEQKSNPTLVKLFALSFLITSCLIIPFSLYYYYYERTPIDFYAFSMFQSLVYLIFSAFISLYSNLINIEKFKWLKWDNLVCLIGIIAVAFSSKNILSGLKYLLRKQPQFMSFVSESESSFISHQQLTLSVITLYLSFFILLLPVFYITLIKLKNHFEKNGFIFLSVITPIFFILICLQKKFVYHFSLFFSILLSINIIFFYRKMLKYLKNKYLIPLIALIILAMLYPVKVIFYFGNDNLYSQLFTFLPAFKWIKENTPPVKFNFNQKGEATYYILSEWSIGHYLQYYSQRPVVVDNFGKDSQLIIAAKILLSYSEKEALELLHKYKIKYIMVRDYLITLYYLPIYLGAEPKEYFASFIGEDAKRYISPVGGLTFGFNLCEKPEIFDNAKHPLYKKIILIEKWQDYHRELYRDNLRGYIYLYEIKE